MKKESHLFFSALQDSFIALLPYFVIISVFALMVSVLDFTGFEYGVISSYSFQKISISLNKLFPFVLIISISHQFSKRFSCDSMTSISLSLAIFISVKTLQALLSHNEYVLTEGTSFLNLFIPISSVFLFSLISKKTEQKNSINVQINTTFRSLYPFLISYIISLLFYYLLITYISHVDLLHIFNLHSIPDSFLFVIKVLFTHLFWFMGIHGTHITDGLMGTKYLDNIFISGFTYKQFYELFTIFGGAGAGLSLFMALFFACRDKYNLSIIKLASPFILFNINEILIFGIPVIFNRLLFIPFISIPLLNVFVAFGVLRLFPVTVNAVPVSWTTPIFINAFLVTNGHITTLVLQLFLLVIDTLIYIPFLTRYFSRQSTKHQSNTLQGKLDLKSSLQVGEGLVATATQKKLINTNQEVERIINYLDAEHLMVYYQPKVDIRNNSCNHFEALLRLRQDDGQVTGPFFLEHLEQAGLAEVIDLWVCEEVMKNIQHWNKSNFNPKISVNLHPDTLANDQAMRQIELILDNQNIEFELIERGLLDNDVAIQNIFLLKDKGFNISIDDFGVGYSSFETLCSLPIDTVKLDKSIVDLIDTPKGYSICKHIADLCVDVGFTCIAEGVETEEQLNILKKLGVPYIQGYFFSPAIPFGDIYTYIPRK